MSIGNECGIDVHLRGRMETITRLDRGGGRDCTFDFVKGAAIILMVWGHAATDWDNAKGVNNWIALFHMPVFLFVAGWFYDYRFSQDWSKVMRFILKKILRLWWPVFLWTSILILLNNSFLEWNFYASDNHILELLKGKFTSWAVKEYYTPMECLRKIIEAFCLQRLELLDGSLWFVRALFFVLCFYCMGDGLLRKCAVRFGMEERKAMLIGQSVVATIAALMARYYLPRPIASVIRHFGGVQVLPCYFLFHIGVLLRVWNFRSDRFNKEVRFAVVLFCMILTIVMSQLGKVSLASVKFPSILFLVVCSLAGWFMLVSIAWSQLAFVGRHSMAILIFHFLAFKIVNVVGVIWRSDDPVLIAGWPTAYSGVWWCIAYTIVGVGVPLFLSMAYAKIKVRLRQLVKS